MAENGFPLELHTEFNGYTNVSSQRCQLVADDTPGWLGSGFVKSPSLGWNGEYFLSLHFEPNETFKEGLSSLRASTSFVTVLAPVNFARKLFQRHGRCLVVRFGDSRSATTLH